jgi:RNA 2',3'-cyclic 3'-phosphodiesterase
LAAVTARIRSFVALALPEPNLVALERHLAECAREAPGYRWVEPDSLHLTLRFLGNLEPEALQRVRDELAGVRGTPFQLALDGRGTFGPRTAPRVVWIGVSVGLDVCAALATRVEAACQRAGLEPEPRRFQAHVTLARARSEGERLPRLPDPPKLTPWSVEDFALYESRLRQQPRYVVLERYALSDPGAAGS